MKKQYIQPQSSVVELNISDSLLLTISGDSGTKVGSGDAGKILGSKQGVQRWPDTEAPAAGKAPWE